MRTDSRLKHLFGALERVSLRAGLATLLLFALVLLLADRGREAARTRSAEIDRAQATLLTTARIGAERQRSLIEQSRALMQLAADLPTTTPRLAAACHDHLQRISDGTPWLRGVFVMDLAGFPFCSSDDELITKSFADRDYFKEAVETGEFVVSGYTVGRVTGIPLMALAYPRVRNATVEAVVAAPMDLEWMSRLAAETGAGIGSEVLLVDGQGTVLAAYPDADVWMGRNLGDAGAAVLGGHSDGIASVDLDGETHLVGHAPLLDTHAVLAVIVPRARIVSQANQVAWQEFGKLAAGGVVLLLFVWLGGEYLVVRPLQSLSASAAKVGCGNLDTRIATGRLSPEMRHVAESFNEMAGQLNEREQELRRVNRMLADLASKDPLTGVPNRRAFDDRMEAEWRRACREGQRLALLVVDIDYFKAFNDLYGHMEGDQCLRRVATVLKQNARRGGDFVARIGGEEFALLLPNADAEIASRTAERIRAEVEVLALSHEGSPIERVTVSVGVAARDASRHMPTPENRLAFFNFADAALYRAKRTGRNQVHVDRPDVSLAS